MTLRLRLLRLSLSLLLLLILLAISFGASFLPLDRAARPLILFPALLMVGIVGSVFMEIGRGPAIVRLFAVAGLLWLTILLGLGSLDPMTRIDYPVQAHRRLRRQPREDERRSQRSVWPVCTSEGLSPPDEAAFRRHPTSRLTSPVFKPRSAAEPSGSMPVAQPIGLLNQSIAGFGPEQTSLYVASSSGGRNVFAVFRTRLT